MPQQRRRPARCCAKSAAPSHRPCHARHRGAVARRARRTSRPRGGGGCGGDGDIVEIIAHVALNLFTNSVNVALDVAVDVPRGRLTARGFQVDGKTDQAVRLMKQIRVCPLDKAAAPPANECMNASGQDIDQVFPDKLRSFELLAMLVEAGPLDGFDPPERSMMRAIGIEQGKPFVPDATMKAIVSEAARLGGAMAWANAHAWKPGRYYADRNREGVRAGMNRTFEQNGSPHIDAMNYLQYMALIHSPALMDKNIG